MSRFWPNESTVYIFLLKNQEKSNKFFIHILLRKHLPRDGNLCNINSEYYKNVTKVFLLTGFRDLIPGSEEQ